MDVPLEKLRGMSRPSKLFIKVDREGLLTDTISISDYVNFDCYESIVTSAQRILACFQSTKPNNIMIKSMFYYKKRARSNRMNPVPIFTTTDGFRAVAEHPSGEVPIGVYWTRKLGQSDGPTEKPAATSPNYPDRSIKIQAKIEREAFESLQQSVEQEDEALSTDGEVPEKRRRTESPAYKTYMPQEAEVEKPKIVSVSGSYTDHISVSSTADTDKGPLPEFLKEKSPEVKVRQRYQAKSNYQWPEDVTCEVILHYDGISERKALSPVLSMVVEQLVKGNFSVLNRDVIQNLGMNHRSPQEKLRDENSINVSPNPLEGLTGQKPPIKDILNAKWEIFNTLSQVSLSKAKFIKLLDWMKSLRLEEGGQGKFYLSERNIIASGLRVAYDSDEAAAEKLNMIYKSRSATNPVKVIYPINPGETIRNIGPPLADAASNQIMFLMPQKAQGFIPANLQTSTGNMPQIVTSQGLVNLPNGAVMVPVQKHIPATKPDQLNTSQDVSHGQKSKHANIDQLLDTVTSSQSANEAQSESTKNSEAGKNPRSSSHTVPAILRRKQRNPVHKVRPSPSSSPTPVHLYRTYNKHREDSLENVNIPEASLVDSSDVDLPFIKQEPEDYAGNAAEEYEVSDKRFSPFSSKHYQNVLMSDAPLPQSPSENNDRPFGLVIKSEPVDDYG